MAANFRSAGDYAKGVCWNSQNMNNLYYLRKILLCIVYINISYISSMNLLHCYERNWVTFTKYN